MLSEMKISIDALLLDPNNPRFIRDLSQPLRVADEKIKQKKIQDKTLQSFGTGARIDKELDVTNIKDLYDSMKNIGFVEIDRVVIRRLSDSNKYLVLEGNRRIATVKMLLKHYEDRTISRPKDREKLESLLDSFKKITCMVLKTEGLSQQDIDHKISILLGLRHHGSLLEWESLPRSYNIFTEYMSEEPVKEDFEFKNKKVWKVASRLSISGAEVKRGLQTYIVYLQIRERFPDVKDRHYSLIEAAITNKYLSRSYFKKDGTSYQLDEQSLAKMNDVCQFSTRDSLPEGKKKIIVNPQKFRFLGSLIDKRERADHEATKDYANDLIQRVEDEDDEITLEQAVDDLTAFENRQQWTKTINDFLDKQEKKLNLDHYEGTGNDRGQKDELQATLAPLRKIMDI